MNKGKQITLIMHRMLSVSYPLLPDGTCWFLVFDFDNHEGDAEKEDYANKDESWIEEVEAHGISSDRHQWKSNNIKDVEIIFLGSGVLFELSKYFAGDVCKCAPFMSLCAKGFESFTDMSKCEKMKTIY